MANAIPDATLLMAPECRHCSAVMEGLGRLLKEGKIGRLEMINIALQPEAAAAEGVRSVSWTRIGRFRLRGTHLYSELLRWSELAASDEGAADYYGHLLESGELEQVLSMIRDQPQTLGELISLLQSLETPMAVRLGVGAALEELAQEGRLAPAVGPLSALTRSSEPQIRADACHYLGLSAHPSALDAVQPLLEDADPEVREIAADSLRQLESDRA